MKDFGKAIISLLAIAAATAGVALAIKKVLGEKPARRTLHVPIKHKNVLTLSDIVNYFKKLSLDKAKDTPFIIINPERHNLMAEKNPDFGENSLLVGVYRESLNNMRNCVFVYSLQYDEALKNVLAKAQDGIVALS